MKKPMIKITEHKNEKGGLWEATLDGQHLAVRAYLNDEEKFEMLKECIIRAKKNIPLEIEVTLPIENL